MNRKSSTLIGVALLAAGYAFPALGATLATYTFPGADPAGDTNAPVATNLTFTAFSRVNVSAVSASELFESASWTTAGTQNPGEYVQFTVTPATNFTLSLTTLSPLMCSAAWTSGPAVRRMAP